MNETAKSDKVVFLHELARTLTPSPFARLEVIGHAFVPIIKGTTEHGVHCDISVGSENGLRSCEMMRRNMAEIAELRPLVVFLKLLLKERGCTQVFTGGLSSYPVFHLVLPFLHTQSPSDSTPAPRSSRRKEELGSRRLPSLCQLTMHKFSQVLDTVTLYNKDTRSLTFENLCTTAPSMRTEHTEHTHTRAAGLQLPNMGLLVVDMCELYGGGGGGGGGGYEPAKHAVCSIQYSVFSNC